MTSNQISYWANVEKERNNRRLEEISDYTAKENARHNAAYEAETKRHNEETEKYGYSTLAETNRHNLAIESISEQEAETKRQQQIAQNDYWDRMAEISALEAEAQLRNADINAINAVTRAREVDQNFIVDLLTVRTGQKNAATARYSAQTANLEAINHERQVDLESKKVNLQAEETASRIQRNKVQNVVDVISTVVSLVSVGKSALSRLTSPFQYSLFR